METELKREWKICIDNPEPEFQNINKIFPTKQEEVNEIIKKNKTFKVNKISNCIWK